jgi:hypothetical protein
MWRLPVSRQLPFHFANGHALVTRLASLQNNTFGSLRARVCLIFCRFYTVTSNYDWQHRSKTIEEYDQMTTMNGNIAVKRQKNMIRWQLWIATLKRQKNMIRWQEFAFNLQERCCSMGWRTRSRLFPRGFPGFRVRLSTATWIGKTWFFGMDRTWKS